MAHKMAATGRHDAELNLIGFLWGRGHFKTDDDQGGTVLREAAYTVREAHRKQFGSPDAAISQMERGAHGKEGFDAFKAVLDQLPWESVEENLCAISRATYDDVVNLCVYGRGMPNPKSPKWERWKERVCFGLWVVSSRPRRASSEEICKRAEYDAAQAA